MTAVITIAGIVLWCATYALAKSYASVWRGLLSAAAFAFLGSFAGTLNDFFVLLFVLMPAGVLGGIVGRRARDAKALTDVEKYHAQKARDAANSKWEEW